MNELLTKVEATEGRKVILAGMILAVAVSLTYGNTIYNEFVFDDVKVIRDNTTIRTPRAIWQILSSMFTYKPLRGQETLIDPGYRPVRYLSYVIDYQFSGLSPVGYHISSMVYHTVTAFLLFLILRHLIRSYAGALVGALIFAVHPVNTEAVAYLTGRKDLLCAIFYLLAFYAFLNYEKEHKARFLFLIVFSYLFALFAKEMAVTFPVVLILFEVARTNVGNRKLKEALRKNLILYAVLFPITVLYLFFVLFVKNPAGMGEEWAGYFGGSFAKSALTMFRVFVHYIKILFFPVKLSADYSYNAFPVSDSLFSPVTTFFALLFLISLFGVGIFLLIRRKYLWSFAIIFFFVSLGPVSQIVPTPERIAERFLYLPSISLAIVTALSFVYLLSRKRLVYITYCGLATILVLLSYRSIRRNADWNNAFTLFSSVVELYPSCARAQFAVGQEFALRAQAEERRTGATVVSRREWEKALEALNKCISILPPESQVGWLRGIALNARLLRTQAYLNLGQYDKAETELICLLGERDVFGDLIGEKPEFLDVHFNLAAVYLAQGKYEEARNRYAKTIELAEKAKLKCEREGRLEDKQKIILRIVMAHYKTAMAFAAENLLEKAIDSLKSASEIAGKTAEAFGILSHLGLYYMEVGNWSKAEETFHKLLALCADYENSPQDFTISSSGVIVGVQDTKKMAYYRLAECQDRQGHIRDAIKSLQNALKIDPNFSLAHFSLGDFYYKMRKLDLAEAHFRDVPSESPDYQRAQQYLKLIRSLREKEERGHTLGEVNALLAAGKRFLAEGKNDAAFVAFADVLNLISGLPDSSEKSIIIANVRLHIGKILFDKKNFLEAQKNLENSIDSLSNIDSSDKDLLLAQARFLLGKSLAAQGKRKEATFAFEEAVKILLHTTEKAGKSLEDAELLYSLGESQMFLLKNNEAEKAFRRVIEIIPNYPGVFYNLGRVCAAQGKTEDAIEAYKKAVESGSKVVESNYEIGLLYFADKGDMESAITYLGEVTRLTKDRKYLSDAYQRLGLAYYALGKFAEAKEAYWKVLEFSDEEEVKLQIRQKLATDKNLK